MSAHGISPYRTALELVTAKGGRAIVFGVTEERGPGTAVVSLLRVEIPVCDEYPTPRDAFDAVLAFHAEFDLYRSGGDALLADLQASVSPQDAPDGDFHPDGTPTLRGRAARRA
jgi:hypothetical protein